MIDNWTPWVLFNAFVIFMMVLDLCVFHRKAHTIGLKEAIWWSVFWVLLALVFNVLLWWWWPVTEGGLSRNEAGLAFLTGYVIERALSIDNIFVFVVLFSFFQLPSQYHQRVLMWGILGAMILRAVFIFAGVALIEKFEWTLYIFGVLLVYTGFKLAFSKGTEVHPERNPVLRIMRKVIPISKDYVKGHFFTRIDGKLLATPLFVVLVIIETTDLVFAIDSIPAIFGVTQDPFIIYTSNIFAILGLRALYFALAGVMDLFHYLHYGLAAVLIFIGGKMLVAQKPLEYHIGIGWSLGIVGGILALATIVSLLHKKPSSAPTTH